MSALGCCEANSGADEAHYEYREPLPRPLFANAGLSVT
jgi:hypothetical protein